MSQALDDLTAQVAADATVEASAITLLNGLKTSLDAAIAANAAGDDSVALNALSASIGASKDALAAAITANTPEVVAPSVTAPAGEANTSDAPARDPNLDNVQHPNPL